MWFDPPPKTSDWSAAIRHLRRADPVMRQIIRRVGPCTLAPRRDYFVVLCKSIYTQQISTKIAGILFARFRDQFPRRRPTPARVLTFLTGGTSEETIRQVGLSRQKRAYLIDLSRHFIDGRIPTRRFGKMTDEQIVRTLTAANGIGRWTAEIFMIFVLNRPDVWPVDDLGIRDAYKIAYQLNERPTARDLLDRLDHLRPYRTIATWYLWRSLELR